MTRPLSLVAFAGVATLLMAGTAKAAPILVGSGPDTATVVFDFPDGFKVSYAVSYGTAAGQTITGYDATNDADQADASLALAFTNYGSATTPNYFLNVGTYAGGHTGDGATYNGTTAPNNYWHEYVDTGSGYVSGNGASNDVLPSGGSIGWVFGSNALPSVPEPTTAGVALIGVALGLGQRRRRPR